MQIELLEAAQLELDQAIEFYNKERVGLGDEFLTEILGALERITEHAGGMARILDTNASLPDAALPPRNRLSDFDKSNFGCRGCASASQAWVLEQ